ncbi:chemotaxis response regulator protein-glutamate methylesterase [Shewanella eurypsychrophilus]|uniref:Protein-glutamate methylesterase/protein-glutamine glutaminase n=1 Tax=Shewanella eurypsychrophilus TaxID=2593656 RepID=A0ABX6V6L0_9GAMM|nr:MULTISPECIES: chemotaxis response regulator protein-glutamate methylesterase [Shewanella]QFU20586.1 chemotaxis-specific protein-glutamate methyltransferase CheB [Shewanella sp. YLB-09]QFU20867.1 chemotaxis-specific protein-glutamate methyltransferase CheB [Shewanella sp. YLB-09]QPG56156.1 chemotaxis response regulator protein-glutamate methylesterase [Shewanella eurypsychrophilus]
MINVLVIDDSPLVRQLLSHLLNDADDIKVIATAEDPYEARDLIKKFNPDVLTLDIEMPKMDGIAFLRNIMKLRPMPVIMVSTLTAKGAAVTLEALSIGAVDFISKPKSDLTNQLVHYKQELIDKVRLAYRSKVRPRATQPIVNKPLSGVMFSNRLIAIGASTGGTEAIQSVLTRLPSNTPPVVIAQHIPAAFSASFAKRLDSHCVMKVIEAQGGELLKAGTAYLAPGNQHMIVVRKGSSLFTKLLDSEPVNRHKPSVDVLFDSVAQCAAKSTIGIILTGMGKDGAKGLLNLKQNGSYTIAQDEASSVVWGMPGAAVEIDAHHEQMHLDKIPQKLLFLLKAENSKAS